MAGKNKYLETGRLADVIAAITALANYRFYKLSFKNAAERIANKPDDAKKWKDLFNDHPEFFRVTNDMVSLVWRRQNPKCYNTKTSKEISREEFEAFVNENNTSHISRRPLRPEETTALIDIAVRLHERAVEDKRAKQWWIPIAIGVLSFLGAVIGASMTR